ncbi:Inositol-pentakisphosphate 2-kinase [Xylographa bjoerkii]|nr:Inositol-pentakisphosphate 2-kinase [Xylographa bjoerkii]
MALPSLPPSTRLTFLAEGAANIVYRISSAPATPPLEAATPFYSSSTPPPSEIESPSELESPTSSPPTPPSRLHQHHQLLRLRKDLPTSTPILAAQAHYETLTKRYFAASELVSQTPVALPPGLVSACNVSLRGVEAAGARDERRRGVWLDERAEVGLLVEDMTAAGWTGEGSVVCLEFKPKWLAQSAGAPRGARRCRTCALGAMRGAREGREGRGWCPLGLVAGQRELVERAVAGVCADDGERLADGVRGRVVDFLMADGLLRKLRELQVRFDPRGCAEGDVEREEFRMAMTLRDCTLFLRIPNREEGVVEAKLGDMDLKSWAKAGYWRQLEERLIREDWYAAKAGDGEAVETVCLLGRAA